MRVLLVEDDYTGRRIMQKYLSPLGDVDIVVTGKEAVEAFRLAWEEDNPYDVVLMDIMMPEMDGQESLQHIRNIEKEMGVKPVDGVKVIMTTALGDPKNVVQAFNDGGADSYLVKPITRENLIQEFVKLGLLE